MGKAEEAAGEYHWKDFEWDSLREQVETNPSYQHHLLPPLNPPQPQEEDEDEATDDDDPKAWQRFHRRHSSGKFFKERRYLLKEFPELVSCRGAPSKLLEFGCGNGSSVIPILRGNDGITVYACDCSAEILATAKETVESSGIADVQRRFHTFQCDFTSDGPLKELNFDSRQGTCRDCRQERCSSGRVPVEGDGLCLSEESVVGGVDFVTLIFSLSAVPFKRMPQVIENCYSVLKPGGMLFFRDYGLYDMTMLRFEPDKKVGFREYMRSDGTRSYFFCLDTVRDLFLGAGFVKIELEFCCVKSVNRRKGRSLKRVWVHGKFQRPYVNTGEAESMCSS